MKRSANETEQTMISVTLEELPFSGKSVFLS